MGSQVQGYCPMGCGQTLFLGSGGYVTCSLLGCPNPGAASDLLETRETEHLVRLWADDFTVQHPLRERIAGELFDCDLHRRIAALSGPPLKPGTYRVIEGIGDLWQWYPLPQPKADA